MKNVMALLALPVQQLHVSFGHRRGRTLKFFDSFVGGLDLDEETRSVDCELCGVLPSLCCWIEVANDAFVS
jgi:hypothetical protein